MATSDSVNRVCNMIMSLVIDCEARDIMHLVASVCPSVYLCSRLKRALGVITSLRCLSVCL